MVFLAFFGDGCVAPSSDEGSFFFLGLGAGFGGQSTLHHGSR